LPILFDVTAASAADHQQKHADPGNRLSYPVGGEIAIYVTPDGTIAALPKAGIRASMITGAISIK
jgi:hypothetical protein